MDEPVCTAPSADRLDDLRRSGRTANLVRMAGSSTERRTGSVHQPRLRRPHTHPLPPRRDGDDAKDDSDDSDDGVFMRPSRPSDPVRSRREQQEGRHGTIQPVHTDSESTRLPSPPMHGNRGPLHPGPALVPLSTTQRVDSATAQGELASPVSPTSKVSRTSSLSTGPQAD